MRTFLTFVFLVLAIFITSTYFAGNAIEERGGIKNVFIDIGKDAKDVWIEIGDYDPDGTSEKASEQ